MVDVHRGAERKATIEIQRRPGRVGTLTGGQRAVSGAPGRLTGGAIGAAVGDPSVSSSVNEVYAPDGFDEKSTILASNFPPNVSINQCRSFFLWIGPVIRVDRAPSVMQESNFVVVFATSQHARTASSLSLVYEDETPIYVRMVAERDTIWKKVVGYFSGSPNEKPRATAVTGTGGGVHLGDGYGGRTAEAASAWLNSATETTGTAFVSAGDTISTTWSQSGATEALSSAAESMSSAFSKASETVQGYMG